MEAAEEQKRKISQEIKKDSILKSSRISAQFKTSLKCNYFYPYIHSELTLDLSANQFKIISFA